MTLVELFPESTWILDLKARDKKGAIREMIQRLVDLGRIKEDAARKAERAVQRREAQGSTAIGKGLALPHAKDCSFLTEVLGVFARSREGLPFDSVDGELARVFFLVVSPASKADEHLDVMKRIARLLMDEKTLKFLATSPDLSSLPEILREIDESVG